VRIRIYPDSNVYEKKNVIRVKCENKNKDKNGKVRLTYFLRWLRKVEQRYDNYEKKNKKYDNMKEGLFIECFFLCLQ